MKRSPTKPVYVIPYGSPEPANIAELRRTHTIVRDANAPNLALVGRSVGQFLAETEPKEAVS